MTDQVYLQKINGNPGFVDGATIPPFASKAALDASGSGWEIGTIANAAGVPYSWRGAGWIALGGSIYATEAQRDEANPSPYLGQIVIMACGSAPSGVARCMHYGGGLWAPVSGEIIAAESGRGLSLKTQDGGFSLTTAQVFYSAPTTIPDWCIPDGAIIEVNAQFGLKDASSTAVIATMMSLAGNAVQTTGNTNAYAVGAGWAAKANYQGISPAPKHIQRIGTEFIGYALNNEAIRPVGAFVAGQTRVRLQCSPGATTNVADLKSYTTRFIGW